MSSTFNDHHHPHHPKREPNDNSGAGVGIVYPPSPSPSPLLKLNKDSHVIKKPLSPSSSSSAAKPRQPVIIYTNTPKIIHTNPKDFMALVQKLTGMSRSDEDPGGNATTDRGGKSINRSVSDLTVDRKMNRNRSGGANTSYNRSYSGAGAGTGRGMFFNNATISEDSESSSVITTDENMGEHGQVNSSLPYSSVSIPPPPHPPPPPPPAPSMYDATGINYGNYFPAFPIFPPANPADSFLCGNQPFASFDDPLYFAPNMRSSFSSSSSSGFDGLTEFRDF
ncbi:unnamed protein product [Microthlaspi erraticum]|uniref:VQ domain-containing protein n=1 Tax=Microthlaspi erraticum TaxID=1685480 RepID=A0A6D2KHK9_9BRAS|nr:unnamed protein product [Microthlaspi erraticum]CAA7053110.1 unnamed protein product [Microthlaspi erraticum]